MASYVTAPLLADPPALRHAFFTRQGGVSAGIYAGLNVGYGSDDAGAAVAENRRRCRAALHADQPPLVTVHQIHSAEVARVTEPWDHHQAPRADALVTDRPGLALGVLAADCVPILLADAKAGVVAAAHAGWGGAFKGVAEATVAAMTALGARADRIRAAMGPCIGPDSYEVGPEFVERFVRDEPGNQRFFKPSDRDGHALFDLPGYVATRLERAGVGAVAATGHDTLADRDRFFSYRRATLAGELDYGRQLSAIMLVD